LQQSENVQTSFFLVYLKLISSPLTTFIYLVLDIRDNIYIKNPSLARHRWLMPVILDIWEAEIRRIEV
jgi:hypothetical protein